MAPAARTRTSWSCCGTTGASSRSPRRTSDRRPPTARGAAASPAARRPPRGSRTPSTTRWRRTCTRSSGTGPSPTPTPTRTTGARSRARAPDRRRWGAATSSRAGPATSARSSAAATRCPGCQHQGPAGETTRHCSRRRRAAPAPAPAHRRPAGPEATMGDPGCLVKAAMPRKGRGCVETTLIAGDAEGEATEETKSARRCGTKRRTRAAEVHNQSERRRRDRINEKMRALQELVPHCNKTDKASILDETIEYLKALQMQVQIMWMTSGMTPMMFPAAHQFMSPMALGMNSACIPAAQGLNQMPRVPYLNLPLPNNFPLNSISSYESNEFTECREPDAKCSPWGGK
ncbi:unnamed protein product [Urochloa humidicola]